MDYKEFVEQCRQEMIESGVEVRLEDSEKVMCYGDDESGACSGFFDQGGNKHNEKPVFAVAMKKPFCDWFAVFVHEFNHFRQWKESDPCWKAAWVDGVECFDLLIQWFDGNLEATPEQAEDYSMRQMEVERNCEIRSLAMIKELDLPLNTSFYAQQANSYIVFYYLMPELKAWYTTAPYYVDEIWKKMPTEIDVDHKKLSEEFKEIYKKFCV